MAKPQKRKPARNETGNDRVISSQDRIRDTAVQILSKYPAGMHTYTNLVPELVKHLNGVPEKTLVNTVWNLEKTRPDSVYKAARGFLRHTKFSRELAIPVTSDRKEQPFYNPLADWLCKGAEECTKAIALGGKTLQHFWSTPDVIGKWVCDAGEIGSFMNASGEIVSVEIKADKSPKSILTAFGQACSYRLFSHRVYIAIPSGCEIEMYNRLETLCVLLGVGLIQFDAAKPKQPAFEVKLRAQKHEPDLYYVNEYLQPIMERLFKCDNQECQCDDMGDDR